MNKRKFLLRIVWVGLFLSIGVWGIMPAFAATITVVNLDDSGPGSLRDAINIATSGDTIDFDAGLDGGTIHLQSTLTTNKSLIISGTPNHIFLSGDSDEDNIPDVRVFHFTGGDTTLSNLTIMEGDAPIPSLCVISNPCGGGILVDSASVIIENSHVMSNTAEFGGGMFVQNNGETMVTNSLFTGNEAYRGGGAIYYDYNLNTNQSIVNSEITNNKAVIYRGGGISTGGSLEIHDSYIHHNSAKSGGGINVIGNTTIHNTILEANTVPLNGTDGGGGAILVSGNLTLVNSTISFNEGDVGGGLLTRVFGILIPNVTIANSTFMGNKANNGAALYREVGTIVVNNVTMSEQELLQMGGGVVEGNAGITLNHTIVANTIGGDNCAGTISSNGYNIVSDNSCNFANAGDMNNENPDLSPPGNYESSTPVYLLLPWSPALDGGDNATCQIFDQRGKIRPYNGDGDISTVCDIGAVENQPCTMTPSVFFTTQITTNGSDNVHITMQPNGGGSNDWYEIWTVSDNPYVHPDELILNGGEADITVLPMFSHLNAVTNNVPDFYLLRSVANCGAPGNRIARLGEFSFDIVPGVP